MGVELNTKPFLVYWNNIPAPYMVERFNILSNNSNFEFEAWFNDRNEFDRSWDVDESSWLFKYQYIKKFRVANRIFHYPISLLKGRKPDILISLYAQPSFIFGWTIAKCRGIKSGFRVVATFDTWVRRASWKEGLKKAIFPHVDFFITEGQDGKAYALQYGAPKERIFFTRHGIDVSFFKDKSTHYRLNRAQLRRKLGLRGTTFIYVGRLVKCKGIPFLLDAFQTVQNQSKSPVSLILVGDGADELLLKGTCQAIGLQNVIFTGFQNKDQLPKFYAASDVFIFPTLGDPYGLVVDEAMASGLPVICTRSVGEIGERVVHGENGFIVSPADCHALADAMIKLVDSPGSIARMGSISESKIAGHTVEKWVNDFEKTIYGLMDGMRIKRTRC